jgi:hypothetical protein
MSADKTSKKLALAASLLAVLCTGCSKADEDPITAIENGFREDKAFMQWYEERGSVKDISFSDLQVPDPRFGPSEVVEITGLSVVVPVGAWQAEDGDFLRITSDEFELWWHDAGSEHYTGRVNSVREGVVEDLPWLTTFAEREQPGLFSEALGGLESLPIGRQWEMHFEASLESISHADNLLEAMQMAICLGARYRDDREREGIEFDAPLVRIQIGRWTVFARGFDERGRPPRLVWDFYVFDDDDADVAHGTVTVVGRSPEDASPWSLLATFLRDAKPVAPVH